MTSLGSDLQFHGVQCKDLYLIQEQQQQQTNKNATEFGKQPQINCAVCGLFMFAHGQHKIKQGTTSRTRQQDNKREKEGERERMV